MMLAARQEDACDVHVKTAEAATQKSAMRVGQVGNPRDLEPNREFIQNAPSGTKARFNPNPRPQRAMATILVKVGKKIIKELGFWADWSPPFAGA
ncbi:hypothetical protein [Bosea sp. LjRoot9]|uniref:hypothetical protein n=1 Tax=Bosea sp. LjRoot9 TaxID=3342341 RepID=UPI003F50A54F